MAKTVFHGCLIKELPLEELQPAAATAIEANPANRPRLEKLPAYLEKEVDVPQFIAITTTKYHGAGGVQLGVSFLDSPKQDLIDRILSHANAWGQYGNVKFLYSKSDGEVRIDRGRGGYWSYLGTDIYHIPKGRPTMNLEGFTMSTPESEYRRVVRHEAAHTLGCPHEHMRKDIINRLDVKKTVAYFRRYAGWSELTTRQQVLTPIEERSVMGTPVDVDSIMCYQLPGSITRDGKPIPGGNDINATDGAFVAKSYPRPVAVVEDCVGRASGDILAVALGDFAGPVLDMLNKVARLPAGWKVERARE